MSASAIGFASGPSTVPSKNTAGAGAAFARGGGGETAGGWAPGAAAASAKAAIRVREPIRLVMQSPPVLPGQA